MAENIRITGTVIGGNHIGKTLGFPTANIRLGDSAGNVSDGVYAAEAIVDGTAYEGMAYIGRKPTVDGTQNERLLEVNLFGYDGDLYGLEVEVELKKFIRPEIRFASLEELKTTVDRDRETIKEYFQKR